jgi:hypothetical protein
VAGLAAVSVAAATGWTGPDRPGPDTSLPYPERDGTADAAGKVDMFPWIGM